MAAALFLLGLLAIAVAIAMLAGLWWGVLAAGLVLVALGVLTQIARPKPAPQPEGNR